jgi:hypothetical protein
METALKRGKHRFKFVGLVDGEKIQLKKLILHLKLGGNVTSVLFEQICLFHDVRHLRKLI